MFTRVPGRIRPVDADGDDDPAIETQRPSLLLTTESGNALITEDDKQLKT